MPRRKQDSDLIQSKLDELGEARWLGRMGRTWPEYVWHFSHVENVAAILRTGHIYSRNRLIELGIPTVDIANPEIIDQSPWTHPFARFYFRPRTPMQHAIEGIRSRVQIGKAHCPVPIFLLFDARELLVREECRFTAGNFAYSDAEVLSAAQEFSELPFREIYHDMAFPPEKRREIVRARCAEILFPDELGLEALQEIVCRTGAERETVLHLLGPDLAKAWRDKIRVEHAGERLFFRDWGYITEVRYVDAEIVGTFRLGSGPYAFDILIRTPDGKEQRYSHSPVPSSNTRFTIPLEGIAPPRVFVEIKIEGSLAYCRYLSRQALYTGQR